MQSVVIRLLCRRQRSPEVRFLTPQTFAFFQPEHPISYSLEIIDLEDGSSNDELVRQSEHMLELEPTAVSRTLSN